MPKRLTKEEFIDKAKTVHGDKYDYSSVVYINSSTKVLIKCNKCGTEFLQTPDKHLRGEGCRVCANILTHNKQKNAGNINARRIRQGIGIIDVPSNVSQLRSFHVWNDMLCRCYSKKHRNRNPSYEGCSVCEEWFLFSSFKKWFDENYVEGYQLDKDILSDKNNKIYSPDTCCFIPKKLNSALTTCLRGRGLYPIGVSKNRNKFSAHITKGGKNHYLGFFNTPEEAFAVYKKKREDYIKSLAQSYFDKGQIKENVYKKLMNYKVEITD